VNLSLPWVSEHIGNSLTPRLYEQFENNEIRPANPSPTIDPIEGLRLFAGGAYFVTLVTQGCTNLFGEINNGVMRLSVLGRIVKDEWLRSRGIRKEIRIHEDEFVVMPNHLHGIVWVVEVGENPKNNVSGVRADGIRPEGHGASLAPLRRMPRSLSSFIVGFKSSVTSRAKRELNIGEIWQRNYYEHIIRNQTELARIGEYITGNPQQWATDEENPEKAG
jgi:REP-associated tyrosine transposase